MITTLSRLPLNSFIELVCGNCSVLRESENECETELKKAASDLIYAYRCIVNPSGMETALMDMGDILKVKSKIQLCKILQALLSIQAFEDVKGILAELGYNENTAENMRIRIERMLAEAEYMKHRLKNDSPKTKPQTVEEKRASFDTEIAFLMTYFKMSIDTRIVTAGVYANMLRQADVEIKRKLNRK